MGFLSEPVMHFRKKKTNVRRLGYLFAFLFADPSWTTLNIGTGLALVAILLHGWAAGYLTRAGRSNRENVLTVQGPYRHNRNPYYVAHLLMDFGIFLMAGLGWYYLIYFPAMFGVYHWYVLKEEGDLREIFGKEFEELTKKVPRWFFRIVPVGSQGLDQQFTWSDYIRNGELKRTLSHLCLIGLLWDFYYLGNPFSFFSTYTQMTIVALFTTWVLVRDVEVGDRKLESTVMLLGGGVLLLIAGSTVPLWDFFHFRNDITLTISSILGGILLLILLGNLIKTMSQGVEAFYETTFRRSTLIPLVGFTGLALVSGDSILIWVGILCSIGLWCFKFTSVQFPGRDVG